MKGKESGEVLRKAAEQVVRNLGVEGKAAKVEVLRVVGSVVVKRLLGDVVIKPSSE